LAWRWNVAEPRDINERIGLDFLVKAGKLPEPEQDVSSESDASVPAPTSSASPTYDADIQAFAARAFLLALQKHETEKEDQQSGTLLSQISSDIGMSAEVLLPLSRRLEDMGMLRTVKRSSFGDNHVILTDKARQLLTTNDEVELLQQLRSA
jgi:hypothetical protein